MSPCAGTGLARACGAAAGNGLNSCGNSPWPDMVNDVLMVAVEQRGRARGIGTVAGMLEIASGIQMGKACADCAMAGAAMPITATARNALSGARLVHGSPGYSILYVPAAGGDATSAYSALFASRTATWTAVACALEYDSAAHVGCCPRAPS